MPRKLKLVAWLPALAWMALIFELSSRSGPGGPQWKSVVAHIVEYSVLAGFYFIALRVTLPATDRRRAAIAAIIMASIYGLSDEWHQSYVPGRVPDPVDWVIDTAAAGAAVCLALFALRRRGGFTP